MERKKRIPTSELNERLQQLTQATQPPQKRGTPLKFLYASQVGTEPPTFAIWCSYPKDVPESYVRYLRNGFRDSWGFQGVPIRIRLRSRRKRKRR